MQVGCGVYLLTVRRRAYLYFWHYETEGRSRVQIKEYVGPARSARSIADEVRADEVHAEQIRLPSVLLGEGLQLRGHLHSRLTDLLRDDDPEHASIVGADDRGVSLSEHPVSNLLQISRGPALGVRDDHRLVDEDCDAKRVEVSRADVEVAVDLLLHDRRRTIIATEELNRVGHPPVRFADPDDM